MRAVPFGKYGVLFAISHGFVSLRRTSIRLAVESAYELRARVNSRSIWTYAFLLGLLLTSGVLVLTGCMNVGGVILNPRSVAWTKIAVGSKGNPKAVTLKNVSTAAIPIDDITLYGADSGDFTVQRRTCSEVLLPSSSCEVDLLFGPTSSGIRTASLTFSLKRGGSRQTIALSGIGEEGSFSIQPLTPTVVVNEVVQFWASVAATWAASCGTIDFNSGAYTAPSVPSSCTVSATAPGVNHVTLSTVVTVINTPALGAVAVYPSSAAVFAGSEQVFQAQVGGVPDGDPLSYTIDEVSGGNSASGTVTGVGVYTAPATGGAHVLAVTDESLGITATATITVFSAVAADFDSRSSNLHAIPPHLFGTERMDSLRNDADLNLVKAGGINFARFYAQIPTVFYTPTPDWSTIDANVRRISAGGVHILLQMYGTPPWLQPNPNPCGAGVESTRALPTDLKAWGAITAQYVKHMDEAFPGVVTDYEIWNEPSSGALCVPKGESLLTDYINLYNAAATQIRAQVREDGSTARVGGPALYNVDSDWVEALLSDATASQNIDFLSYHHYIFGLGQLVAKWDTYNGGMSVYQATQDSSLAPMGTYLRAAALVAAGKQPQGKDLPIYDDEYNLNWAYAQDCCRNDFTYGPVWNAIYVSDMLNAVYAGASKIVAQLGYFAATARPYFCLVGEVDQDMDCAYPVGVSPQPYPQYFAYQLIGAPNYLGLQDGGFMAKSISPATLGNGLVVTAFYTAGCDAIVIINPSQYTYTNMPVNVANTGFPAAHGTLYQIVNGRLIQSSPVQLKGQGNTSYSTALTISPYSVQAISLQD